MWTIVQATAEQIQSVRFAYSSSRSEKQREARARRLATECQKGNAIKQSTEARLERMWRKLEVASTESREEQFSTLLGAYTGLCDELSMSFDVLFPRR